MDAQSLWWPPARNLYNSLDRLQADPTGVSPESLQSLLDEAAGALQKGLLTFRRPDVPAKSFVEKEASLSLGSKRIPLDQALRAPAIRAAEYLVISGSPSDIPNSWL